MFINENNLKELPQADVILPSLELDSAASVRGDNFIMEQEIWKSVSECADYEVSSLKRVRSLFCKNGKEPYILKVFISKTGYYVVNLWINGQRRTRKLHRIYAIAFIPNPNNYPQINHKDGDKLNLADDNLQWSTQKMNIHHAFRTGLIPKVLGDKQSSTKLKETEVIEIYKSSLTKAELARKYNKSFGTICSIKNGLSWSWLTGAKNSNKYKTYDSDIVGD